MDFPNRLKLAMARAGVSSAELAQRTALTRAMIHRYESGKGKPQMATLARLSVALGVRSDWLLYGAVTPDEAIT